MTSTLTRLRALEAAATKGPWEWKHECSTAIEDDFNIVTGDTRHRGNVCELNVSSEDRANAALIAALRNAAPALLAVVEAAQEAAKPRPFDAVNAESHKALLALRGALAALEKSA
jgi:hypothetical protein